MCDRSEWRGFVRDNTTVVSRVVESESAFFVGVGVGILNKGGVGVVICKM